MCKQLYVHRRGTTNTLSIFKAWPLRGMATQNNDAIPEYVAIAKTIKLFTNCQSHFIDLYLPQLESCSIREKARTTDIFAVTTLRTLCKYSFSLSVIYIRCIIIYCEAAAMTNEPETNGKSNRFRTSFHFRVVRWMKGNRSENGIK